LEVVAIALTIFLSAFLLFEIQPMIAKYILPWFGGAPTVWTTCMLFFQVLLLGGYAYAHLVRSRTSGTGQTWIHLFLLGSSLLLLVFPGRVWDTSITASASWRPDLHTQPVRHILGLLAVSIGLPYFVLSSTAPLLQSWYGRRFPGVSPYPLYALSNLGSLLALLGYPFFIEWLLPLKTQARLWTWAYVGFALGCGFCALRLAGSGRATSAVAGSDDPPTGEARTAATPARPAPAHYLLWVGLAACGSTMLLASTNQLCLSVAAVPFLWLVPLSLYLVSFIICFHSERWYKRGVFQPAFALGAGLACVALYHQAGLNLEAEIAIYSLALFAGCMVCHGELVRLKPPQRYLTVFYLLVAAGGALGGVFVSLLAPAVFNGYWEYHLSLWGSALLLVIAVWRDKDSWLYDCQPWLPILIVVAACLFPLALAVSVSRAEIPRDWRLPVMGLLATVLVVRMTRRSDHEPAALVSSDLSKFSLVAALIMLGGILLINARKPSLDATRNFYGVLTIRESSRGDPTWHAYGLSHGPVVHGMQFQESSKRRLGATYYGKLSAVGVIALGHPRRSRTAPEDRHLRIGVVGLGVGTIAVYAEAGDYLRFYEINPDVIRFAASRYFSYLRDCPARVEVIEGDARLSLEAELRRNEPQQFDFLVLDAFAGDAIPVHLLTREAFEIYLQHLREPDGLIIVHVSNAYVDLRPVLWKTAEHFGLVPAWIHAPKEGRISGPSEWVVLAPNRTILDLPAIASQIKPEPFSSSSARLWTDDYSNLFQALRR
jgi:hypothetical protein